MENSSLQRALHFDEVTDGNRKHIVKGGFRKDQGHKLTHLFKTEFWPGYSRMQSLSSRLGKFTVPP